jgi:hypothetical protein
LYFKADQAYNALDHYQRLYQSSNPAVQSEQQQLRDHNELMHLMRETGAMAMVFPKNAATHALFESTKFRQFNDALLKERLQSLFDASELLRERALINKGVLDYSEGVWPEQTK